MIFFNSSIEFVKSKDLFGNKIDLNYKRKGEYKTFAGGLFSIMIQMFVLFVLIMRLHSLFYNTSPSISK